MKYGKFLDAGETIGFAAPSFGCAIEPYRSAFDNALKKLTSLGYGVQLGPNCYSQCGIGISNTPKNCGRELTEMYTSSENQVLLSCGGGELMCETISNVDWEKIKTAPPKWYMGFSDNTNMTFLLATLADTASIYGPSASALGMNPWHPVISMSWEVLTGQRKVLQGFDKFELESLKTEENPLEPYNCTMESTKVFRPDSKGNLGMKGRLLGGCIDILDTLVGTKFDKVEEFVNCYKEDGIIWFLEACDLNMMAIRRAVWQLKEAGWFAYTKGFLIGRPLFFGQNDYGLDQYHAFYDLLEEYDVPVIMDMDLGHLPPSLPLICGSLGTVTVSGQNIQIQMECI